MDARRLLPVLAALLVVLSGCAAPLPLETDEPSDPPDDDGEDDGDPAVGPGMPGATTTPTPTPDGTPQVDDDVEVEGGSLDVDEDLLFARVERLVDADVEPGTVYLRDLSSGKTSSGGFTPVYDFLGVGQVRLNASRPAGLTQGSGDVYFDPAGAEPWLVEARLVHEFVHVVQFRAAWFGTPREYETAPSQDFVMAWRAVAEGGAVYAADAYIREYVDDRPPQSALLARDYRAGRPDGNRVVLAPYHFGARYVRAQVDSPRNLSAVYDTIPRTTEQVLHNETPASEPPLPLDVDTATGDTFDLAGRDRGGEMFLRTVLRAELDRETAAAAAAGWGTDRWVTFSGDYGDRWGLAWVTRWDTTADAEEFADAAREYARARERRLAAAFRVVRLSADTVVLLAGDEEFVEGATVEGGGTDVSVSVTAGDGPRRLAGHVSPAAVVPTWTGRPA